MSLVTLIFLIMVSSCVAFGCHNRVKAGSGISFHRFPHKNPELLQKWLNAIKRKDWLPKAHSYICSVHFQPSCFVDHQGQGRCRLKEDAVPTIFAAFPNYYQRPTQKRKSPKKRIAAETVSAASPSKVARDHLYNIATEPEITETTCPAAK